jgi:hypothetical protein
VASAILMELNIRLTVLVVETARLERRGVNDKNHQIFQRIAQKVAKSKKAKISKTKLNLKVQNIHIKPLLKP